MIACCRCGSMFAPTGKGRRCPPCRRVYDAAWRARRKVEGRPVKSTKMPRAWHAAYEAEYYKNPANRARSAERMRRYARDPKLAPRHKARLAVRRAIESGHLTRQPCECCGAFRVHAHHDDYSKPLQVRWLCPSHHREVHAKAEGRS